MRSSPSRGFVAWYSLGGGGVLQSPAYSHRDYWWILVSIESDLAPLLACEKAGFLPRRALLSETNEKLSISLDNCLLSIMPYFTSCKIIEKANFEEFREIYS